MDAAPFLERPKLHRLFVVHGDEDFLRRLVHRAIRKLVLGEGEGKGDDGLSSSSHAGDTATFAEVMDELQTVPFFGDRRLVVVDNADPFVTRYKGLSREKGVGELPAATGVLVLDVKSWTSTTRLAKLVDATDHDCLQGLLVPICQGVVQPMVWQPVIRNSNCRACRQLVDRADRPPSWDCWIKNCSSSQSTSATANASNWPTSTFWSPAGSRRMFGRSSAISTPGRTIEEALTAAWIAFWSKGKSRCDCWVHSDGNCGAWHRPID